MAEVLYKINGATSAAKVNTQIMTVCEVLKGEVVSLLTENDIEVNHNIIHASSVPYLIVGDKVVVQEISENIIVTDKLRNAGDTPTIGFDINEDGSLNLFSDVSIVLKTSNAKIKILASGKIMINGNEVYSISKGINRIQGTGIELN